MLKYCPKCRKVFYYPLKIIPIGGIYCPNCRDGYEYHAGEDVPDWFLDQITLREVPEDDLS